MALQTTSSPSFANPNVSKLFEPNHSPSIPLINTMTPNIPPRTFRMLKTSCAALCQRPMQISMQMMTEYLNGQTNQRKYTTQTIPEIRTNDKHSQIEDNDKSKQFASAKFTAKNDVTAKKQPQSLIQGKLKTNKYAQVIYLILMECTMGRRWFKQQQ